MHSDDLPYLNSTYLLLRQDLIQSTNESVPASTSFISEFADSHSRGHSLRESSSQEGKSRKNEHAASAGGSTSGKSNASTSENVMDKSKRKFAKWFKINNK